MAVKITDLDQRITFEVLSRASDGQGGWTESWAALADGNTPEGEVWALVRPKSSRERYFSQAINTNVSHEIVIRWKENLTTEMRISFQGRIFQIHGIRREDEKRWFMYIDAEEGVGS